MGVQIPHGKGQFWGKVAPIAKYRDTMQSPVRKRLNRSSCSLDCDLGTAQGIMGSTSPQVQIHHEKGQFWGKGWPIVKYMDFLP